MKINFKVSFCPYCGTEISDEAKSRLTARSKQQTCESCNQTFGTSPKSWVRHGQTDYEYKSKLLIFRWPLIHIAFGIDPKTNKSRIARGFIAIGNLAIGGIAMGGVAIGGLAFGGLGIGMVSIAGCAVGLLVAFGGCAVGTGLSIGGMAVGTMAIGGGAFGYYAIGGGAHGVVAFGGNNQDQVALAFFRGWRGIIAFIVGKSSSVIAALVLAPLLLVSFVRNGDDSIENRLKQNQPGDLHTQPTTLRKPTAFGLFILILAGSILGITLAWTVLAVINFVT
ncbi:MAG: hypothetical protein AB8B55_09035 [Mariniblastus sp.]